MLRNNSSGVHIKGWIVWKLVPSRWNKCARILERPDKSFKRMRQKLTCTDPFDPAARYKVFVAWFVFERRLTTPTCFDSSILLFSPFSPIVDQKLSKTQKEFDGPPPHECTPRIQLWTGPYGFPAVVFVASPNCTPPRKTNSSTWNVSQWIHETSAANLAHGFSESEQ